MLQNVFIAVHSTMSEHNFKWSLIIQFLPNWERSGKTAVFHRVLQLSFHICVICWSIAAFNMYNLHVSGYLWSIIKKISTKTSAWENGFPSVYSSSILLIQKQRNEEEEKIMWASNWVWVKWKSNKELQIDEGKRRRKRRKILRRSAEKYIAHLTAPRFNYNWIREVVGEATME